MLKHKRNSPKRNQYAEKSNFEKIHLTQEDRKKRNQLRDDKKMDFYLSMAKFTYTAVVLGIVVSTIQSQDDFGIKHVVAITGGVLLAYIWYRIADNYLKK